MAARYWVGGNANWDTTAGTKWALTSGGAGGQVVPTAADDVFLDNGAGTGNVTLGTAYSAVCKTITCTGYVGTLSGSGNLTVSGPITFVAGMTVTTTGALGMNVTATHTSAGKTWGGPLTFSGTSTITTLADNWTITGSVAFAGTAPIVNGNKLIIGGGLSQSGNPSTGGTTEFQLTGTGTLQTTASGGIRNNITIKSTANITFGAAINWGVGILLIESGATVTTTGSVLTVVASAPTITNNNSSFSLNTLAFGGGSSISSLTLNGTNGITMNNLIISGFINNGALILKFGNTYTVNTALTGTATNAAKNIVQSDTGGSKVVLYVSPSATTVDCGFINFTDVDNSLGRTIWTYKGTISNCNNINVLPTQYGTIVN